MEGEEDLDILTSLLAENDAEDQKQDDMDELFDNDDDAEFDDGEDANRVVEQKENVSSLFGDVADIEEEETNTPTESLDSNSPNSSARSKEHLEAELRHMQEQMRKLQQQLEASQRAAGSDRSLQLRSPTQAAGRSQRSSDKPELSTRRSDSAVKQKSPVLSSQLNGIEPLKKKQRVIQQATGLQNTPILPSSSQDVATEKFSGLRLRRPRVSSIEMESKMKERRLIRLSQLPDTFARENLDDCDWVTFAVLVSKVTPQSHSSGKTFSIWKLNDLRNLEVYVSLFLFGEVHKEHWKTDSGTVIGILNPNPMKPKEGSDGLCLSVDHPQKILIMGEALDFGTCRATKKNGEPCSQLVNVYECQYCLYHVKSQYKSMSSKRAELQSSFSGKVPGRARGKKAVGLKERLCQSGFYYGGVSSAACAASLSVSHPKKPKQTTLGNLFVRGSDQIVNEAKRLAMRSNEVSGCSDEFKDLLSVPSPGALNLKKHLMHGSAPGNPAGTGIQSISASQLIKQQKQQLLESRRRKAEEIQQRFLQNVADPCQKVLSPNQSNVAPKDQRLTPKLGRGFSDGEDVLFFDHTPSPPGGVSAAKLAALRKVRDKGAMISKEDPNATKKKRSNVSEIVDRVEKNMVSPEVGSEVECQEPAQKRRCDQLDYLHSEEFQQILNAKSRHWGDVQAAEFQIQEKYFDALVKKEQMEEKMKNIREMKCRAVTCRTCKYTYFKPLDSCVEHSHEYHWHDAVKRFFKCPCGQRAIALDRLPHKHCSNCGLFKWQRDGMIKEKSGPKIGGELLLPRGEEQPKFLNSMK